MHQQKQSTKPLIALKLKSSTIFLHLPDFYHSQHHQASHHTVQRMFSVRRKPMKQNHEGYFIFKPLSHNPLLDFHCRC
jgi:hypothetical protein